ncbi:MAG TPA: UDP-N-acetylmuramate dehydrogenase [Bacteroidia bacterium]
MLILVNHSLKKFHTFGTDVYAKYFTEINSIAEFKERQQNLIYTGNDLLILGGGSNLLFTKNYEGLVIKNNLKGIEISKQDEDYVWVKAAAGENWHNLVLWCVANNYGGVENLSLIPGCVGASPMQNIGAYGVELKDVCHQVYAVDLQTGEEITFSNADCKFGYRESVFKNIYRNKYLITAVVFKLNKKPVFNTSYGAIEQELQAMGVTQPTIKAISDAVIHIRQTKLPDPAKLGNAGSFFKNPEVTKQKHDALKQQFPKLVAYPLDNGNYKLAAGWLIEQCGFKGQRIGDAGVHANQALVLVNYGAASGNDIYALSQQIISTVSITFEVTLEREVNIY